MAVKELTEGSPLKLIILFMLPIFIGNLFQQFYNLFDALIVGRILGVNALAAVGATGSLIFLYLSFIFATTQGFTVITAQKFGAGNYNLMRKSVCASIILSGLLTLILTLLSAPFSYNLLSILRTPQDIIIQAEKYLFIMFIGIIATVYYNLSSNIIRALGDSKTPLYFLIFSSFLNIIMDIVFVLYMNWGIKGAAWATVISQAISTVLCLVFMFKKFPILKLHKEDWEVSKEFMYEHLRIGIPMGFQMSVLALGMIAIQFVLNSFGSVAVAAFTTAIRIDQCFSNAFIALGATMAVFTAQNFGAGNMTRIRQGAHVSVGLVLGISAFSITMLLLFSGYFIGWFMDKPNPEVTFLANRYLHIIMLFYVFIGLIMSFKNILQGMGNVMAPLLSSFAELIARTACAFVLADIWGYTGVCLATPAAWVVAAIVLYASYKISFVRKLIK